jgi:hypothetical protein
VRQEARQLFTARDFVLQTEHFVFRTSSELQYVLQGVVLLCACANRLSDSSLSLWGAMADSTAQSMRRVGREKKPRKRLDDE